MKFGQLIEYNIKNIYIGKSYTKYDEEASTRVILKSKLTMYLGQQSKML